MTAKTLADLKPGLYAADQEPAYGFCVVCNRKRPIGGGTVHNFGCYECEADDEDREQFGSGELRLECAGCSATCAPCFE